MFSFDTINCKTKQEHRHREILYRVYTGNNKLIKTDVVLNDEWPSQTRDQPTLERNPRKECASRISATEWAVQLCYDWVFEHWPNFAIALIQPFYVWSS